MKTARSIKLAGAGAVLAAFTVPGSTGAQPADCAADGNLRYVCGPQNAEDIVRLGAGRWLIASGMSGEGPSGPIAPHLYLVDRESLEHREWFPGPNPALDLDRERFPDCPGPLDLARFSAHGLSLLERDAGRYDLYVTSHGAREAIEVFEIDLDRGRAAPPPSVRWIGCVVLPDRTFANSVAVLDDGGFVTTKMMDPTSADGFAAILAGEITGLVYEWHPGGRVEAVTGTEMSGANGIAVSADGRWMYVASIGTGEIVRFDRHDPASGIARVSIPIRPDNLRWGDDGALYTVGGNLVAADACGAPPCDTGWSIVAIDSETLVATRVAGADQNARLQAASTALPVDDEIWIGTFRGDRIGVLARP